MTHTWANSRKHYIPEHAYFKAKENPRKNIILGSSSCKHMFEGLNLNGGQMPRACSSGSIKFGLNIKEKTFWRQADKESALNSVCLA